GRVLQVDGKAREILGGIVAAGLELALAQRFEARRDVLLIRNQIPPRMPTHRLLPRELGTTSIAPGLFRWPERNHSNFNNHSRLSRRARLAIGILSPISLIGRRLRWPPAPPSQLARAGLGRAALGLQPELLGRPAGDALVEAGHKTRHAGQFAFGGRLGGHVIV